jgi:hypothetical protein
MRGILIPLHAPHFSTCLSFIWSYCALVSDPEAVPMAFVLSNATEEAHWRRLLTAGLSDLVSESGARCDLLWNASHWEAVVLSRDGRASPLSLDKACRPHASHRARLHPSFVKFRLVALKRIYGILHFGFEQTLALDAETRVLRPLSIRRLFDDFNAAPSFWMTRKPHSAPSAEGSQLLHAVTRLGLAIGDSSEATGAGHDGSGSLFFHDTQHWFYDLGMVRALASVLEEQHGTVARGVCDEPTMILDQVLLLAFAYNRSHGGSPHHHQHEQQWHLRDGVSSRPFYDTQAVLRHARLGEYADRLLWHHHGGSGEALLQVYGRHMSDAQAIRRRLLSVLDEPARPIFVYRELNTDLGHKTYLDASDFSSASAPDSDRFVPRLPPGRFTKDAALDMLRLQRELVCASGYLAFSVCDAPTVPFHCRPPDAVDATTSPSPSASSSASVAAAPAYSSGNGRAPRASLRVVIGPPRRNGWPVSQAAWIRLRMKVAGLEHLKDPRDTRVVAGGTRNFNLFGLRLRERCALGDPGCFSDCYRNCTGPKTRSRARWRVW